MKSGAWGRWFRGEQPRRGPDEAGIEVVKPWRISDWWTGRRRRAPRPGHRLVYTDPSKRGKDEFIDNSVTTSRYTLSNFAPLFLLEQFSRAPNIYFLAICVLQTVPTVSLTNGVPTTAIPLAAILAFDAAITGMFADPQA